MPCLGFHLQFFELRNQQSAGFMRHVWLGFKPHTFECLFGGFQIMVLEAGEEHPVMVFRRQWVV